MFLEMVLAGEDTPILFSLHAIEYIIPAVKGCNISNAEGDEWWVKNSYQEVIQALQSVGKYIRVPYNEKT